MYLLSRLLYATIVMFTGGGIAFGCVAKGLQLFNHRAAEKPWRKRLCNVSGIVWSAVACAVAMSALYCYSVLIPEHHLKIVGLFPIAAAILTLYKYTTPS